MRERWFVDVVHRGYFGSGLDIPQLSQCNYGGSLCGFAKLADGLVGSVCASELSWVVEAVAGPPMRCACPIIR